MRGASVLVFGLFAATFALRLLPTVRLQLAGLALLAVGIRAVHAWTWARSLATLALVAAPVALYDLVAR